MIGKICKASTPFYNAKMKTMSFKSRPALVLAKADMDDYVILPVSTISHKENIHPEYDVKVEPGDYPKLKLHQVSYVRTHKQTVVHRSSLIGVISDMKSEYPDLYLNITVKMEQFQRDILSQAI